MKSGCVLEVYIFRNVIQYQALQLNRIRDSAVGIKTGYGLDGRGIGFRVPVEARIFSSSRSPDWFWAHPASYSMGTGGSFSEGKAADA
jgi:hypothetical protein